MIKVYIFNKSNNISRVYDFKKFTSTECHDPQQQHAFLITFSDSADSCLAGSSKNRQ